MLTLTGQRKNPRSANEFLAILLFSITCLFCISRDAGAQPRDADAEQNPQDNICAQLALASIGEILQRPISEPELTRVLPPSGHPVSIETLISASNRLNFLTAPVKWKQGSVPYYTAPSIIYLLPVGQKFGHYVLLLDTKNGLSLILDTPNPPKWIDTQSLWTQWNGVAIYYNSSTNKTASFGPWSNSYWIFGDVKHLNNMKKPFGIMIVGIAAFYVFILTMAIAKVFNKKNLVPKWLSLNFSAVHTVTFLMFCTLLWLTRATQLNEEVSPLIVSISPLYVEITDTNTSTENREGVTVDYVLKNPTSEEVRVDKVTANCSCVDYTDIFKKYKKNSLTKFQIFIKRPDLSSNEKKIAGSTKYKVTVQIRNVQEPSVELIGKINWSKDQ